jgi:hypothetical protein
MRNLTILGLVLLIALPVAAAEWKGVSVVDAGCAERVKGNPDKHTRACMMRCEESGYGVIADGNFIKFDEKGNSLAIEALQKSTKDDAIHATITGEIKDGVLYVETLTLDE